MPLTRILFTFLFAFAVYLYAVLKDRAESR